MESFLSWGLTVVTRLRILKLCDTGFLLHNPSEVCCLGSGLLPPSTSCFSETGERGGLSSSGGGELAWGSVIACISTLGFEIFSSVLCPGDYEIKMAQRRLLACAIAE